MTESERAQDERKAFERSVYGLPAPSLTLRCVTCGKFLSFQQAVAIMQIDASSGWQVIAPGPYDSRCASKVPAIRKG